MLRTLTATSQKSVLPYGLVRTRHFTALCPQAITARIYDGCDVGNASSVRSFGHHTTCTAACSCSLGPPSLVHTSVQPGTGDREVLFSDSWTLTHNGFEFLPPLPFVNLEIMAKVSESLLGDGLSITQAPALHGACFQRTL